LSFIYRLTNLYRREQKALKVLHKFTNSVISKRREEIEKGCEKIEEKDEFGIKRKMAFLDVLLQSKVDGKALTNDDIREEVDTFMFEGHDTTASGVVFCLYNIAKYQEIQQKVYEECEHILGDKNNERSTQKMNELSYLELVIKESQRLYPSVPFFSRKLNSEVEVEGILFPENVTLGFSPYNMGRDPDLFANPLKFDPLRFSIENEYEKRNPYGHIPFSAGSRNCE
jgi:cytochrome P450 family 4